MLFKSRSTEKQYFVQIRVIQHLYDAKAMEKIVKFRSVTSFNPCPLCRLVHSTRGKQVGVCIFEGGRYLLDCMHVLRRHGQSKQCCPSGYYNKPDAEVFHDLPPPNNTQHITARSLTTSSDIRDLIICEEDEEYRAWVKRHLLISELLWHHSSISYENFRENVYFHHCDFRRPPDNYHRVSNELYNQNGSFSSNENVKRRNQSKKETYDCNGVYGLWSFAHLSYTDISTMLCWDPFHTLKNICKNMLQLLTYDRKVTPEILSFSARTHSHPYLSRKGDSAISSPSNVPWALSKRSIEFLDNAFSSILFPTSLSNDNKLIKPFSASGNLTGIRINHLFANFMELVVLLIINEGSSSPSREQRERQKQKNDMHPYLCFLCLFSEDIVQLQRPYYEAGELDELYLRIIELGELHAGLFPLAEAKIGWHQLVDIVQHIQQVGVTRDFSCLAAERMISSIKRSLNRGGQAFDASCIRKHLRRERSEKRKHLSASGTYSLDRRRRLEKIYIRKDQNGSSYVSDHFISLYSNKQQRTYTPTQPYEYINILYLMVQEGLKYFEYDEDRAIAEISLCRLFRAYLVHLQFYMDDPMNFYDWLEIIHTHDDLDERNLLLKSFSPTQLSPQIIVKKTREGIVFDSDVKLIPNFLSGLELEVYSRAVIYGCEFVSRGSACCEQEEAVSSTLRYGASERRIDPKKKLNNLHEHLSNKAHYSTWFRFKHFTQVALNDSDLRNNAKPYKAATTDKVGQFNFFSRIRCPWEPLLHNIPIGAATCRNATAACFNVKKPNNNGNTSREEQHAMKNVMRLDLKISSLLLFKQTAHRCHIGGSRLAQIAFVSLTDVYPNPQAILPMDINHCPVSRGNLRENTSYMYLVGLAPSKMFVTYNSTIAKETYYNQAFDDDNLIQQEECHWDDSEDSNAEETLYW